MAKKKPAAKKKRAVAKRRRTVANLTAAQATQAAQLLGVPVNSKIIGRIGKEYARVSNPSAGAFERCVKAVGKKAGIKSPGAVCAAAERKAGLMNPRKKKAKRNPGKKRKNPIDTAAAKYEEFHGRQADDILEVTETLHEHSVLSGIGTLHFLTIAAVDGSGVIKLQGFKGARLAQDEEGQQLYIVGGDQSVDPRAFGIRRLHELEVLGAGLEVAYITRKDHLGKSGGEGERAIHVHDFGSKRQIETNDERSQKGSRLPIIMYDVRNEKLMFAGGGYDLPEVGIRG
jgi:hypothetical protein